MRVSRWWIRRRLYRRDCAPKLSRRIGDVRFTGDGRRAPANSVCPPGNGRCKPRCRNRTRHARCRTKEQYRWLLVSRKQAPGLELLPCMAQGWYSCRHSSIEYPHLPRTRGDVALVSPQKIPKGHFERNRGNVPLHFFFFQHRMLVYTLAFDRPMLAR